MVTKNPSELKVETEGLIIVAQNQSLPTIKLSGKYYKNESGPICRWCEQKTVSIDHLVSGCPIQTPIEYKKNMIKLSIILIGKYANPMEYRNLKSTKSTNQNI